MENNLPEGWEEVELSFLVDYKKGKKPKRMENKPFNGSLVYLDIRAIEKKNDEIFVDAETSNATDENELIVVWDGARAGWVGKSRKGALGSTLMGLRPKIDRDYLYRFIQTQFDYLQTNHRGTGIPHVDPDIFWNIKVPVAPEAEQQRIVAKLDELMEKIDSSRARLERIPKILKRFRQSILSAAVSESGDPTNTEQICEIIQIGPFGTQLHKHDYISNGIPLINPTHIQAGQVTPDSDYTISKRKFQELSNYHLKEGDVIMGRRGEMARCALIGDKEDGWLCGTGSLFFRPNKKLITPQYLYWLLSNSNTKEFLESESKGTTMSNLNLSIAKRVPIFLPPIVEQERIVNRVEQLFSLADKIEARYTKAKAQVDKLPQCLLAKAFRGELVPHDEKDEPAGVLLERINKDRSKASSKRYDKKDEETELAELRFLAEPAKIYQKKR